MIRHVENLVEELDIVNKLFVVEQLNGVANFKMFERTSIFVLST
jgi:hypothetical protein